MNANTLGIIGLFLTVIGGGWTYTQQVNDAFTQLRSDIFELKVEIQHLSDRLGDPVKGK